MRRAARWCNRNCDTVCFLPGSSRCCPSFTVRQSTFSTGLASALAPAPPINDSFAAASVVSPLDVNQCMPSLSCDCALNDQLRLYRLHAAEAGSTYTRHTTLSGHTQDARASSNSPSRAGGRPRVRRRELGCSRLSILAEAAPARAVAGGVRFESRPTTGSTTTGSSSRGGHRQRGRGITVSGESGSLPPLLLALLLLLVLLPHHEERVHLHALHRLLVDRVEGAEDGRVVAVRRAEVQLLRLPRLPRPGGRTRSCRVAPRLLYRCWLLLVRVDRAAGCDAQSCGGPRVATTRQSLRQVGKLGVVAR